MIFTFNNFIKAITIFCFGLISRHIVNEIWDVNVFIDYLNSISLIYYGFFSTFIVAINDFFSHYKFYSPIQKVTLNKFLYWLRLLWNGSDSNKMTMGVDKQGIKPNFKHTRPNKPWVYWSTPSGSRPINPGDFPNILNPSLPTAHPAPIQNPAPVPGHPNPVPGHPNPVPGQQNHLQPGFYHVPDPLGQGTRGYINPATNRPYPTSQPYARNLSARMLADANRQSSPTITFSSNFGHQESRFFREYMIYNHPNRDPNQYWNSTPVRRSLNNCN